MSILVWGRDVNRRPGRWLEVCYYRLPLEEERPYWEEYFELLAQRRNYIQALTLVERVCGICSNVHTLTMCMAAEAIAGIELPLCANYMRSCTI